MSAPKHPESENALPAILETIRKERDEIKVELQTLSNQAPSEVEEWIRQAKQLQADIERSKQTARSIVQEAQAAERFRAAVQDASTKTELLRKELDYNDTLASTIDSIQVIAGHLDAAQDAIAGEELVQGLDKLETAEKTLAKLDHYENMRFSTILMKRERQMKEILIGKVQKCWAAVLEVRPKDRCISIHEEGNGMYYLDRLMNVTNCLSEYDLSINELADIIRRVGILEKVISQLHSDLDNIIIHPRFTVAADGAMLGLEANDNTLQITGRHESANSVDMVEDIRKMLEVLKNCLPTLISKPLLERILPSLTLQLIDSWLNPRVPVELDELATFGSTLDRISDLATYIESFQVPLPNEANLSSWIEQLPSTWMARRRESALSELRRSCYTAVKSKRTVERSETQTLAHDDALIAGEQQEDEWNEDWDDAGEDHENTAKSPEQNTIEPDDEDTSAWGLDDDDAPADEGSHDENAAAKLEDVEDDDAWGWGNEGGDEEAKEQNMDSPKPSKPTSSNINDTPRKKEPKMREITLTETYTITGVPDTILNLFSQCLSDASRLASGDFPIREVSAAAPALSSIPTLLLSFYRATATTIYNVDPAANMLIYNDSQQLISALEDLTKSLRPTHPLASRLRLDNDIKHLTSFAKRAYGREMDSQRTILRDLLSSTSGFVNASAPINAREYKNAVDDAAQRIRDVDRLWQPVLSSSARLQSVGSLLSTVTTKMVADILELADDPSGISEEQSKVLKGLCDQVVALADLFEQRDPNSEETRTLVHVYSPEWLRFVYLGEILDASLADIKYLWTEGELSLEFEEAEVADLIKALFAESEYRRNALREIRGSGKGRQ